MNKILLILSFAFLSTVSCNKSSKKSQSPEEEVYCIYNQDGTPQKVFISCEKSKEAMQKKSIELRDAGMVGVTSVKKSTCSDC